MKVLPKTWDIVNPEKLYKQFQGKANPMQADQSTALPDGYIDKEVVPGKPASTKNVLSANELATLSMLFGYDVHQDNSFYGRNKIKNVHSGHLLDVKG